MSPYNGIRLNFAQIYNNSKLVRHRYMSYIYTSYIAICRCIWHIWNTISYILVIRYVFKMYIIYITYIHMESQNT